MFIELTNDETGNLVLINTSAIRSVFINDKDIDKAVVCYTGDVSKYLNVTESYAEVVTLIRNATEPKKVESVCQAKGVFKYVDFEKESNYRFFPSASSVLSDMLEEDNDEESSLDPNDPTYW